MITTLENKSQILDKEKVLKIIKNQEKFFDKYQIKTLALFGSTARNEATENSDLDFLVEFNTSPTFDNYMDLKFYLEKLFNKSIDLVIKQDLKPVIREEVMKDVFYVS
ncbi:nucleotidyltransferase family protein [Geminocystis sp. CENA526]|uniref:nucleotidyltransferase family protein n=1 Tax=Geminocystis sp. CENA526 TaxID=1355871 RepID=UPI003D6DBFFC